MEYKIVFKSALLTILLSVILPLFESFEPQIYILVVLLLLFNVAYIITSNAILIVNKYLIKKPIWEEIITVGLLCIYSIIFYKIFVDLFWLSLSVIIPELLCLGRKYKNKAE